jgi:probable HAF family extracellular repeat protein
MRASVILCGVVALLLGVSSGGHAAPLYTFTTIDRPGAAFTEPVGINSAGQIVGYYSDTAGRVHGFLLSQGTFSTIDPPGAASTQAIGINSAGEIVGNFSPVANPGPADPFHGFLLSAGGFSTIDVPGALLTAAYGINDGGRIVGVYADASGMQHGFLQSGGGFTTIDVPGAAGTVAFGINTAGQIVGNFATAADLGAGVFHGYRLSEGSFSAIDVPGAQFTQASGINASGQLVGSFLDAGLPDCLATFVGCHGFVLDGGEFTTVDFPGSTATLALGINDHGQIVGVYAAGGAAHGFLATPVAAPSTLLLLSLGALGVLGYGRCRR